MALPANKLATKLAEGLGNTCNDLDTDDATHIKMEKSGDWVFGSDENEVEPESTWAIDPESLVRGFIAWGTKATGTANQVLGEEMELATAAPILKSSLHDVVTKWGTQIGFTLKCLDGEHEGIVAKYKASSKGALKAYKKLVDAIVTRAQASEADLIPVVVLDSEFYKHKEFGKIFNPILTIEDWTNMGELSELEEAEDEPEVEAVVEPEPTPEPEPEVKPKRRRRRKTAA